MGETTSTVILGNKRIVLKIYEKNRCFKDINNSLKFIKREVDPFIKPEIINEIRAKAGIKTDEGVKNKISQLINNSQEGKAYEEAIYYCSSGYEISKQFADIIIDYAKESLRQGDLNGFNTRISKLEQLIDRSDDNVELCKGIRQRIAIERAHASFMGCSKNLESLATEFRALGEATRPKLRQASMFCTPPRKRKRNVNPESPDSSPVEKKQKCIQKSDTSLADQSKTSSTSIFGGVGDRLFHQSQGGSGFGINKDEQDALDDNLQQTLFTP